MVVDRRHRRCGRVAGDGRDALGDAKAGTAANVLLLSAAGYGFASLGPASFAAEWNDRTRAALATTPPDAPLVTEADLASLPEPVARYVRLSGAVGRPRVTRFYAEIHGRIRGGPDKPWMEFTGRQLNTYGETPQRLFSIDATMFGLPVTVFHAFDAEAATMRGKVLSLVPILDAKGPEMNRSEQRHRVQRPGGVSNTSAAARASNSSSCWSPCRSPRHHPRCPGGRR